MVKKLDEWMSPRHDPVNQDEIIQEKEIYNKIPSTQLQIHARLHVFASVQNLVITQACHLRAGRDAKVAIFSDDAFGR